MATEPPEPHADFFEKLRRVYEKKDGDGKTFEAEAPILRDALSIILAGPCKEFDLIRPLGRGGAGVVCEIRDRTLGQSRALKIPRPGEDDVIDSVKNEIANLKGLKHEHLIRVHLAGEVEIRSFPQPYPFFVMDYLPGVKDLAEAITEKLEGATDSAAISGITRWLAGILEPISAVIYYLHSNGTLHFDIKPANIFVTPDGKPLLGDLGYAKRKTDDTSLGTVGFTLFYAHPTLRGDYQHMSSLNRVRKPVRPSEFNFKWDIYAFGRSILQALAQLDAYFPEAGLYDYTFVYLHLSACRMLDGRNLTREETERIREEQSKKGLSLSVYKELWLTLDQGDMKQLSYSSSEQLHEDFKKLRDTNYFARDVPELSHFYPSRVQISEGQPAPFSSRVKAVVEHPVFLRLRAIRQLGVADTVFPGCNHTRFEHSIGVFRMAWLYLQSLLMDPYNPIFRQLCSPEDIKGVLLAALLHDVGQFPLAHDIEDALVGLSLASDSPLRSIGKHESLTAAWFANTTVDASGRTLREIIEKTWGVKPADVLRLITGDGTGHPEGMLAFEQPELKMGMLRSIISGPIDVDKMDYLIRDSSRAELPYGASVDLDRLVRSITIVVYKRDDEHPTTSLVLGSYEKGQSAAESITFARYQMYQALYFHHTCRAIRPMLRTVIRGTLQKKNAKGGKGANDILMAIALRKALGIDATPQVIATDEILEVIERQAGEEWREIIELIRARRFYKRLITIHSYPSPDGKRTFLDRMREATRDPRFDELLQSEVLSSADSFFASASGPLPSMVAGPNASQDLLSELRRPGRVLADCPTASVGGGERLRFVLEPKRRLQNYITRIDIADRVSEVWQQVYVNLMNIASKGRVYCHPKLRDPLMATLGPSGIEAALKRAVIKQLGD